jgi:hypothetical protein
MTNGQSFSLGSWPRISTAACERGTLRGLAGHPSNPLAAELIDRANAQTIIGKWEKLLGLSKTELKKWPKSQMHELFDLRNGLVHEGRYDDIKSDALKRLGDRTAEFVDKADAVYRSITGAKDYRTSS